MTLRTTALFIMLALAGASLAVASSYSFTVGQPINAGSVKLIPGDYKVSVEGTVAKITGPHFKTFTVPVKSETGTEKFKETTVETIDKGGQLQLEVIDVGGSTTKLVFNN